jgi:hypothetical protein
LARQPNYKFERQERDKAKAAKKASRKAERAVGAPDELDADAVENAEAEGAPDAATD